MPPSYPDVGANLDRFSILLLAAQPGVQRMHRGEDLNPWSKHRKVPDDDLAHVEHNTIEVEEHTVSKMDVGAVITIDGGCIQTVCPPSPKSSVQINLRSP